MGGRDANETRKTQRRPRVLLSPAELRLLAAFEDMVEERPYPYVPTIAELAARLNRSDAAVHEVVQRLRDKRVLGGRGRSLHVIR